MCCINKYLFLYLHYISMWYNVSCVCKFYIYIYIYIYICIYISYSFIFISHCISTFLLRKGIAKQLEDRVPEFNKIRDVASTLSHFVAAHSRVESLRKFRQLSCFSSFPPTGKSTRKSIQPIRHALRLQKNSRLQCHNGHSTISSLNNLSHPPFDHNILHI